MGTFFMNYCPTMGKTPGERLREAREEFGKKRNKRLTQRDAATSIGINEDTYRSYEYGKSELPLNVAEAVATIVGKAVRWFYEGEEEVSPPATLVASFAMPIPFIGSVNCSTKADWSDPLESTDTVMVPAEMAEKPDRFACTALGDSCYPLVHPGDLLVFQKEDVPKIGSVVLHRANDHRITVKQLKHDGKGFILHAINPSYEDVPAEGRCVGFLVGIIREVGTRRSTEYDRHGIRL